jgi:hypothetical protein
MISRDYCLNNTVLVSKAMAPRIWILFAQQNIGLGCVWSAKKHGTTLDNFCCTLFNLETGYGIRQNRQ